MSQLENNPEQWNRNENVDKQCHDISEGFGLLLSEARPIQNDLLKSDVPIVLLFPGFFALVDHPVHHLVSFLLSLLLGFGKRA